MDLRLVHRLAGAECRGSKGPLLRTHEQLVADATFGAVEIVPVNEPTIREQSRALLSVATMQVVYLPHYHHCF